jgi:NhaA family Na+:H+ antiporter
VKGEKGSATVSGEATAGIALLIAGLAGLAAANSSWHDLYRETLHTRVTLGLAPVALAKPFLLWINDGLMAIFFLLVGLEIKREVLVGPLSNRRRATLPVVVALGGMIVPALIYCAINWDDGTALRGWAIPTATDIAFAVAVMASLGSRIPPALKAFLLALAIIDDLGAILIIALFYTNGLSYLALAGAAGGIAILALLNRSGVTRVLPYLLVGFVTWLCVLESGVHATLAGVATALAIPLQGARASQRPLETLEHALAPWVNFLILPLFAFANAGVSFAGIVIGEFLAPIPLGIALGLIIGKPIGIYAFARGAIRAGVGEMPPHASLAQLFGAAILGGIGFTMSLFIGLLAFPDSIGASDVKLGVLTGSVMSATLGYFVLRIADTRARGRNT